MRRILELSTFQGTSENAKFCEERQGQGAISKSIVRTEYSISINRKKPKLRGGKSTLRGIVLECLNKNSSVSLKRLIVKEYRDELSSLSPAILSIIKMLSCDLFN